jgi:hypothetical protein
MLLVWVYFRINLNVIAIENIYKNYFFIFETDTCSNLMYSNINIYYFFNYFVAGALVYLLSTASQFLN